MMIRLLSVLFTLFCAVAPVFSYGLSVDGGTDDPPLPSFDTPFTEAERKEPRLPVRQTANLVTEDRITVDILERAQALAERIYGDGTEKAGKDKNGHYALPVRKAAKSAAFAGGDRQKAPYADREEEDKDAGFRRIAAEAASGSGTPVRATPDNLGRGVYIASDDIRALIRDEIESREDASDAPLLLNISGLSSSRGYFVRLNGGGDIRAELEYVDINEENGRLEAAVIFRNDGAFDRALLRGRAEPGRYVYAPSAYIGRGEIITEEMIEETVVSERAAGTMLTDKADIVGNSASRALRPGRALRERDVKAPLIVKRNDVIDIEYEAPGIFLRATARASEDGARGDVIRARNMAGDKVIYAQVTGPAKAKAVEQGAR